MSIISAILSLFLIGYGVVKVYGEDCPKSVFYGILSFFGAVTFIASVVMIFIPDFFVK